ncbi:type I-E CRISPR-associated protein Cse1/CasA [Enterobacteriaceae bacterium LUAb1]
MNLLTDPWIPVRSVSGGVLQSISLQTLLCESEEYVLNLTRDDMELAACQLLICIVQIIWPPENLIHLLQRLQHLLDTETFNAGVAIWQEAFDLAHPDYPFMQVRGVVASKLTAMDKLMAGLTGSTSCAFVNQADQARALCGGCCAIALFNQAGNAPGFGGGFKNGLRGATPISTLILKGCLRQTIWANVLTQNRLDRYYPGWRQQSVRSFTWQTPVDNHRPVLARSIGLVRGLFWQPAHIELSPPQGEGMCSSCGHHVMQRYDSFLKAKFSYILEGFWLHPHSPHVLVNKQGTAESHHMSFNTATPLWLQIRHLIVGSSVHAQAQGYHSYPALVVEQASQFMRDESLHLLTGGYCNNQATILERRYEIIPFREGWTRHLDVPGKIVQIGIHYWQVLRKALHMLAKGTKDSHVIGAGIALHEVGDRYYFQQGHQLIMPLFATIDYRHPQPTLAALHQALAALCLRLFDFLTEPYIHHPKLFRTQAIARRRVLMKHLSALQMQGEYIYEETP